MKFRYGDVEIRQSNNLHLYNYNLDKIEKPFELDPQTRLIVKSSIDQSHHLFSFISSGEHFTIYNSYVVMHTTDLLESILFTRCHFIFGFSENQAFRSSS